MDEKLSRLQNIFREVLDSPALALSPDFSAADCEDWDSVATVRLVLEVEREFGVRFMTDEVAHIRKTEDFIRKIR